MLDYLWFGLKILNKTYIQFIVYIFLSVGMYFLCKYIEVYNSFLYTKEAGRESP